MIALVFAALADPTPPADVVTRPKLLEPVQHLLSDRTKKKVNVPSTVLFEWHGSEAPAYGTWIDLWTRTAKGVCSPQQRLEVVMGPGADDPDRTHAQAVVRAPESARDRLTSLKYLAWTVRSADDTRTYDTVACPEG